MPSLFFVEQVNAGRHRIYHLARDGLLFQGKGWWDYAVAEERARSPLNTLEKANENPKPCLSQDSYNGKEWRSVMGYIFEIVERGMVRWSSIFLLHIYFNGVALKHGPGIEKEQGPLLPLLFSLSNSLARIWLMTEILQLVARKNLWIELSAFYSPLSQGTWDTKLQFC